MAYRKLTTAQVEALKAAAFKVEPGIVIIHPTTNEILGVVDGLGNLTELGGGGPGGAVAFTDLTDCPGSITSRSVVVGNDAGDAIVMSSRIEVYADGTMGLSASDGGLSMTSADGGNVDIEAGIAGTGRVNIRANNQYVNIDTAGASGAVGITTPLLEIDATAMMFYTLPTSNPAVAGQLWNDAGTLKISAG